MAAHNLNKSRLSTDVIEIGRENYAAPLHDLCAVYTRPEIVRNVLDLVGWTQRADLSSKRLLEPGAGNGAFVVEAVKRLILSIRNRSGRITASALKDRIVAYEIANDAFEESRRNLLGALADLSVGPKLAEKLATDWLKNTDFLIDPPEADFTHVVGNPPYIRWSNLPSGAAAIYSARLSSDVVNGDLCVPFFDKAGECLVPGGKLAFVCTDRWLRSAYGRRFRNRLSGVLATRAHLDLRKVPVFLKSVSTYPSITLFIRRSAQGRRHDEVVFYEAPNNIGELKNAVRRIRKKRSKWQVSDPLKAKAGWVIAGTALRQTVEGLANRLPSLEDAGCRIRVGTAIGNPVAFVGSRETLGVEPELLLPFVSSRDLVNGHIEWQGDHIINPFDPSGGLRPLSDWPGLRRRMHLYKEELQARACVNGKRDWYRTIDKIDPKFTNTPKILIPELAKTPRLAVDDGEFQPGNSLYAITSEDWVLEVLFGVLSVGVLGLFVSTHSPKVNGGYMRFYRHILRNIRIPGNDDVAVEDMAPVTKAIRQGDWSEVRRYVADWYGIEESILTDFSASHVNSAK